MAGSTWYNVIALATSKGGVAKTTLARSLAAYWFAIGHKPALIDADPEKRLFNRYNEKGPLGAVPVISEPEGLVAQVIEELRARHRPVIVDSAGFRNRTTIAPSSRPISRLFPLSPHRMTWMQRSPRIS
jgi:chromosome partitioning protein